MNKTQSVWMDSNFTKEQEAEQIYTQLKCSILHSDRPALDREWDLEQLEKLYKLLKR